MDDVRLRGGGELLLFFLVSRRSFGSSEFIVVVVSFRLCNGSYYVYLTPIFGRVFKQEIFKAIVCGCRVCGGRADIESGAGQVVLAELLPAAGDSAAPGRPRCAGCSRGRRVRRRWCAGWRGEGVGDVVGDGRWREVEVHGVGLPVGGGVQILDKIGRTRYTCTQHPYWPTFI